MQKISPFLWFDGNAEEAMNFYTSIFSDSQIESINRSGPEGKVISGTFLLGGMRYMALNGGPHFKFTPALSLYVNCESQEEVNTLWEKLSEGGEPQRCGWVKDKFGLSWQIIPTILGELLNAKDPVKAARVMNAMLGMQKIDISALKQAYEG
ncbi:3-demethylubiquinone-9 3-methyltransferase [Paenibacillus sp. Soil766]|uniref:VOC family protein n=1 Tax=Paenibacillus sp. Soil766 TaxID=1736404 RepID=UPI0007098141|nr:VOC family protein [Paenibacillus sp. Soil766]KRF03771.1 3-demethylubiquinone-9 3-methyltransferase [Paenibacillus sp. Soil766]